jgi:hypothetical protein
MRVRASLSVGLAACACAQPVDGCAHNAHVAQVAEALSSVGLDAAPLPDLAAAVAIAAEVAAEVVRAGLAAAAVTEAAAEAGGAAEVADAMREEAVELTEVRCRRGRAIQGAWGEHLTLPSQLAAGHAQQHIT